MQTTYPSPDPPDARAVVDRATSEVTDLTVRYISTTFCNTYRMRAFYRQDRVDTVNLLWCKPGHASGIAQSIRRGSTLAAGIIDENRAVPAGRGDLVGSAVGSRLDAGRVAAERRD